VLCASVFRSCVFRWVNYFQLRFHIEKVRARNLWHQASRFWRKLLSHTVCVKLNMELGNEPLQFEGLITH
ncbi:MAG: hypothetical protein WB791_10605, partial [Waddliaceae bacterium]